MTGWKKIKADNGTDEYRCQCGYQGWTSHIDILRAPVAD